MRDYSDFKAMTQDEQCLTIRHLRMDVKKFESAYAESGTPKAAVQKLVKSVGKKRAAEVVASLVNECAWDGRICRVSKDWAHRVDGAWSAEAMDELRVYSTMHRAHLDQIACEMARMDV